MNAGQTIKRDLYLNSEQQTSQYAQALRLIEQRAVGSVIMQMEFTSSTGKGERPLMLSEGWISIAKRATANSVKVCGVIGLTRFQSWMRSYLKPEHYELDSSMILTKNETGRYLNPAGVSLISRTVREAVTASGCKLDTIYYDFRYPIYPILGCSENSRLSSIIENNIDPIDVESPNLGNLEQWLANLPEDNRQVVLRYCESRQKRLLALAESVARNSNGIIHRGFLVSQSHFGLSPLLKNIEGSSFLDGKRNSVFDRLLIVPTKAKIPKEEIQENILKFFSRIQAQGLTVTCVSGDQELVLAAQRKFNGIPNFTLATPVE
jgi:hypothetical protein